MKGGLGKSAGTRSGSDAVWVKMGKAVSYLIYCMQMMYIVLLNVDGWSYSKG